MTPIQQKEQLRARAKMLGFDAIGFARADVPLAADYERYQAFIAADMQGDMSWLAAAGATRRQLDEDTVLAGAKSVLCLARSYRRPNDEADPPFAKTIARYARGRDYHNFIRRKLRQLAAFARTLGEGVTARPICDDAPVLERAWAARAGLGFVGKNGMLITPGLGSFVLLGEVVTTLELPPDEPMSERCGSCTRCLDACPTSAFPQPFVLDARKCISYLTIEKRSESDPLTDASVGDHLFGCDDCQTVCPFNASKQGRAEPPAGFEPLARWKNTTLEQISLLSEAEWAEFSSGTPLHRATLPGIKRNALRVLRNRKSPAK